MVITNPTNSTVSIVLDGVSYSVAPKDSTTVPSTIGKRWAKVHEFLVTSEEEQVVVEEALKTVVEDSADNVKEETERVNEVKESPVAPAAPARGKGLIARLKAAAKGKK